MADPITRQNHRARATAQEKGHETYQLLLIDTWPACTECGSRIRSTSSGARRRCECPDVEWACLPAGWRRVEAEDGERRG